VIVVLAVAPNSPTLNSPADESTGNPTTVTLNVTVTDDDSSYLNVSFYGREKNWTSNSSIVSGLGDIGLESKPIICNNCTGHAEWELIAGHYYGGFYGFYWDGTEWVSNSTISSGLTAGSNTAPSPTICNNCTGHAEWEIIVGYSNGSFNGFYWNGTSWVSDSDIVSGLGSVGTTSKPTICNNCTGHAEWELIAGEYDGTFNGFYWNGTSWVSDSDIISGLGDIGIESTPTIYNNCTGTDNWELIGGNYEGIFRGFYWNGTSWVSDSDIISGLGDIGTRSAPTICNNCTGHAEWELISGTYGGGFSGFKLHNYTQIDSTQLNISNGSSTTVSWSSLSSGTEYIWHSILDDSTDAVRSSSWSFTTNYLPTQPSLTSPDNNSYLTSIMMNWTASTDADSDTIYYYVLVNGTQACYTISLNCSYDPADGYYEWNVTPFDGTANGTTSLSRFFTFDTTNPSVNYSFPTPSNNTRKIANSVTINVSYYDLNFNTCIFTWQGTNETFTSSNSNNFWETKTTVDGTTYTFQAFCSDLASNINSTELRTFRENAKPTLASVSINDSTPTDLLDLKCENGTTADSDNDSVSFTYNWYNNSIAQGINNSVLASGNTTSGDSWYCSMTPQDGYEDGTIKYSATVSIGTGFVAPVVTNTNATTALSNINSTSTNPTNNNSWINLSVVFTDTNSDESWTVYFCNTTNLTACKTGSYFCKSNEITDKSFSCKYNITNETSRIFTYYPQVEDNNSMTSGSGVSNTFEINYPPSQPNGTSPLNSSFIKTNYTFINFSDSDSDGDSTNYTVWGGTDQTNLTSLIYNGTNEFFNWTNLSNTIYYFKLKTTDEHGYDSTNSTIYSFTIDTIDPVLTLSSPTSITYYLTTIDLSQTASDTNLDSCFYYILYKDTRSIYKANTTITCGSTTSISAGIYSGGYSLYVLANDSAGNLDTKSVNFTVLTSPLGGSGSPGGSGGAEPQIIFVEAGNFSVETEFGSSYYNWVAVPSSTKSGKIIIKNLGLNKITVSVSCTPLGNETNGYDVCSFVTFDRSENIEVYPGGKLEEEINFNITAPSDIAYGKSLIFGIIVEDQEGHKSTPLHVETKIGRFIGFISLFFEKMFSGFYTVPFSKFKPEAQNVTIPYLIPAVFATLIFGFLTTWIIGKIRFKNKFLSNIKTGVSAFSIFVFFIVFLIII